MLFLENAKSFPASIKSDTKIVCKFRMQIVCNSVYPGTRLDRQALLLTLIAMKAAYAILTISCFCNQDCAVASHSLLFCKGFCISLDFGLLPERIETGLRSTTKTARPGKLHKCFLSQKSKVQRNTEDGALPR